MAEGCILWANFVGFGQLEFIVGLLVWTAAAILLILTEWMIGSTYRAQARQRQTEAEASRPVLHCPTGRWNYAWPSGSAKGSPLQMWASCGEYVTRPGKGGGP